MPEEHKHILSALVEDRPGVLAHIAGLFSSRGYNIDSLTVGATEREGVSRMTIVAMGDDQVVEQVTKQLRRLVNVLKVQDFMARSFVSRDLVLVKISCPPAKRSELCAIAEIFRANVVHVGEREMIIELTGDANKVEAFLGVVAPYGVKELARTGQVAMARDQKT
jgi:acetolactate synthase-1/3 small subunit